jgi:hypothetical protein
MTEDWLGRRRPTVIHLRVSMKRAHHRREDFMGGQVQRNDEI